jgi:hypothetical protein
MILVFVPMLLEFHFHQNQIFLEMVQLNLHLEHLEVHRLLHHQKKLEMKATLEHLHLHPVVVMWMEYFQMLSVVLIFHNQHHHQNRQEHQRHYQHHRHLHHQQLIQML